MPLTITITDLIFLFCSPSPVFYGWGFWVGVSGMMEDFTKHPSYADVMQLLGVLSVDRLVAMLHGCSKVLSSASDAAAASATLAPAAPGMAEAGQQFSDLVRRIGIAQEDLVRRIGVAQEAPEDGEDSEDDDDADITAAASSAVCPDAGEGGQVDSPAKRRRRLLRPPEHRGGHVGVHVPVSPNGNGVHRAGPISAAVIMVIAKLWLRISSARTVPLTHPRSRKSAIEALPIWA